MLEIILISFFISIMSCGLSLAFIGMTDYRSILGFIRYWIAVLIENHEDMESRKEILDRDINASQQAELMNEEYYWQIAKHSRLMFLMMCKYCLSVWISIILIIKAKDHYDCLYIKTFLLVIAFNYLIFEIIKPDVNIINLDK